MRIRDRGHPNRHLRGLSLGGREDRLIAPGTPLFGAPDQPERKVGSITSVAWSERADRTLAMGYLRREVVPGSHVAVAQPGGLEATVVELGDEWWRAGE